MTQPLHIAMIGCGWAGIRHARALDQCEEPLTGGRAQRHPLELVLAAYQSMETGLPVRL